MGSGSARGGRKPVATAVLIIIVAAVVIAVVAFNATYQSRIGAPATASNASGNSSSIDLYAHLSNAGFALMAPIQVLDANRRFEALAQSKYNFLYANALNFTGVEKSQFIVLVANDSNQSYWSIAQQAVNSSMLAYAVNSTRGIIISKSDVWAPNQTVFVLVGYKNASALSSALLSFFVKSPVYPPQEAVGKFAAFNGIKTGFSGNDPVLDAYLDGTYELGPHDTVLKYPYDYYLQFASLIYYAPVVYTMVPGFEGNSSGTGLPMSSPICVPPPPPPDGASICIGDYVAMPMFQMAAAQPQPPQFSLDSGDCYFFGIEDCINAEGWAASGINPQLPWYDIPSVNYAFTRTGSEIPPSLSGTTGPVASYLPITWWIYGPGSLGESTGGFQSGVMTQNETQLLMDANVTMFSAPLGETPLGNFTVYNATNASSTYSCASGLCGMRFNYGIYALLSVSSTIPQGAAVLSPMNYSQAPHSNYSAVLEPVMLSTPKVVRTSATDYYFSYWSVYSELAGNQYYQRYNTANATFELIGPTQVQAVYTSRSLPGAVTAESEYMTFGTYNTCPPPLNCSVSSSNPIGGVNISITSMAGQPVYSNTTGSNGRFVTPVLPAACYQVSAYKNGYSFIVTPNPLCINGHSVVAAVDVDPFVFSISWPKGYAYSGAPVSAAVPVNLTLTYITGGHPAGNIPIRARTDSGTISGPSATSANGTADFIWHTGHTSGLYHINFTATGLFGPSEVYTMPVIVYSKNYSQIIMKVSPSKSSMSVSPGSSANESIKVHACQFSFSLSINGTLSCSTAYPVSMSVSGLPSGATANFTPNTTPATLNSSTLLSISAGSAVGGTYSLAVTATITLPNSTKYSGSAPLSLAVGSHSGSCNGFGAISGSAYRFGEPTPANISVSSSSGSTVYRNATHSGMFNTGSILPGGSYIVTAYSLYSGSYSYGSATVNVTPCVTTNVMIGQPPNSTNSTYGALNITVARTGGAASGAEIFAPPYNGLYAGSNGQYYTGFTIVPGNYTLTAVYDNYTSTPYNTVVTAGHITSVYLYVVIPVNTTTTSSTTTATTTSTASTTSTTTVSGGHYNCNECYHIMIAGYTCPSNCPNTGSCIYGGFECTT